MDLTKLYVYDEETYKELFSFSIVRADGKHKKTFKCSAFHNDIEALFKCLDFLRENDCWLVGFNSIQFDYPVLHQIIEKRDSLPKTGKAIAAYIFKIAQKQIDSFKFGQFGNTVKFEDQHIKQLDLFKIHHFDNKARMTSLKLIEFNLRMQTIVDLPYDIYSKLTLDMVNEICDYNEHDVEGTRLFLHESLSSIDFRFKLSEKHGKSFHNHNDGKIGKDYFQIRLAEQGVALHKYKDGKKVLNQTIRKNINIGECLFDYYDFKRPEFIALKDWFSKQVITETKGVFSDIEEHRLGDVAKYAELEVKRKKFKQKPTEDEIALFKKEHPLGWIDEEELKATEWLFDAEGNHVMEYPLDDEGCPDFTKKQKKVRVPKKSYWGCWKEATTLNVVVDGFRFDFGVGGIHGSIENKIARENSKYMLKDADVSSMYPNLAISNNVYPEHLGIEFCSIYQDVYEQRKSYPKGSAENGMLKLALNSVYGESANQYSVFFDTAYTMKITVNGQLSLCLLAEKLLDIPDLKIIQVNTDGITVALPRVNIGDYDRICKQWEQQVKLQLEYADYSKMIIRDVNNYIAVYTNGKVKRKGAYQYEGLGFHQNQSSLVVPMAAEAYMLDGTDLHEFISEHFNKGNVFDFMLRTKVDRSSRLVLVSDDGTEIEQQRVCRYYPSKNGGKLVKIMKPLEGSDEPRRLGIDTSYKVKICNDMQDFDGDIDFDYYVQEAKKLVIEPY